MCFRGKGNTKRNTEFWNKWSWGFCAMALYFKTYKTMEFERNAPPGTHLVTSRWEKSLFKIFCVSEINWSTVTHCHEFLNKWSRGLCVIILYFNTYKMSEYELSTPPGTHLVTSRWEKSLFKIFGVFLGKTDVMTVPHCHECRNIWSWGIFVMPLHSNTNKMIKCEHYPQPGTHLVTSRREKKQILRYFVFPG